MRGVPTAEAGPGRDRCIDLVRAASIVAVVVGHWLVADLDWQGELVRGRSALGSWPGLWPLTWLLQVMGLFFFVGGFANRRSWEHGQRRGEGYAAFIDRRLHRLVVPALVFLVTANLAGLGLAAAGGGGLAIGSMLTRPLWFVAVYAVVIALTPVTLAAHRRWGWAVLAWAAVVVAIADGARIASGTEWVALANVVVVWGAAHQLGYAWAEGSLTRRVAWGLALGGFAAVSLLTTLGPYPARMVGVRGDALVNAHPPTLALAALAAGQIGVAVLVRPLAGRALQRDRCWRLVVAVNLVVMTVFVWHETAMALAARVGFPLGLPHPDAGTPAWFPARAVLMLAAAAVLAGLVAMVGRVETRRRAPPATHPGRSAATVAVVAVVLVGLGFLGAAGSNVLEPGSPVVAAVPLLVPAVAPLLVGAGAAALATQRAPVPTTA